MTYGADNTEGWGTAAEDAATDPFAGIEGRIAKELRAMHYELPADDALLMGERAYALAEEHIIGRMREVLMVTPDASLKGMLEFWTILGNR